MMTMLPPSVEKALEELLQENFTPCVEILLHKDNQGCVLPCCSYAYTSFRCSVISASSLCSDGIEGVLHYLNKTFAWGLKFETHLCKILTEAEELDCGASTAIALLGLRLYLENLQSLNGSTEFSLTEEISHMADICIANVQLIVRDDPIDASATIRQIRKNYGADSYLYCRWIRNDALYHQCVGIYSSKTGQLKLWDYGKWRLCTMDTSTENSVLAIRINPTFSFSTQDFVKPLDYVLWDGKFKLPFGEWVKISSSTSTNKLAEAISPTDTTKYPEESVSSFDAAHSKTLRTFESLESHHKSLVLYLSGCHMSSNPMTGTGIARSLRTWFDIRSPTNTIGSFMLSTLKLVGVDDASTDNFSGLSDGIFDQVRSVLVYGTLRNRDPIASSEMIPLSMDHLDVKDMTKQQQDVEEFWESIVTMLNSSPRGDVHSKNYESFFIPVSRKIIVIYFGDRNYVILLVLFFHIVH